MQTNAAFCVRTLAVVAFETEHGSKADIPQTMVRAGAYTIDAVVIFFQPVCDRQIPITADVRAVRLPPRSVFPLPLHRSANHSSLIAGSYFQRTGINCIAWRLKNHQQYSRRRSF